MRHQNKIEPSSLPHYERSKAITRWCWCYQDILVILFGLLMPLSLSPFDYYILAFVSIIGLIFCINNCSWQRAAFRGYLYGCSSFGFGVSWIYISIHEHGQASALLAGFLTSLLIMGLLAFYPALKLGLYNYFISKIKHNRDIPEEFQVLARRARRRAAQCTQKYMSSETSAQQSQSLKVEGYSHNNYSLLLIFPSLWVIIDWIQGWLFTGFPWLYIGYSQIDSPLAGFAPIVSVFGLTWLVIFIACLIYLILKNLLIFIKNNCNQYCSNAILGYILIVVLTIATGASLNNIQWSNKNQNYEKTVLVQGSIPQSIKWSRAQIENNIITYTKLSEPYWQHSTIIWPESAITIPLPYITTLISTWHKKAANNNSTLLLGVPAVINNNYFNSIMALGVGSGYYYKNKLVPWGEYVPFEKQLRGLIEFFDLPMSNFISGTTLKPNFNILQGEFIKWLPFICYEIAYPAYVISHAKLGDAIVTISNDAWFGNSIGPWQHLQMVRMRALETARPVARSTNNGITTFIAPNGKILKQLPQFTKGVLIDNIYGYHGQTPIMYIGVNSIIAFCFLLLFFGLWLMLLPERSRLNADLEQRN